MFSYISMLVRVLWWNTIQYNTWTMRRCSSCIRSAFSCVWSISCLMLPISTARLCELVPQQPSSVFPPTGDAGLLVGTDCDALGPCCTSQRSLTVFIGLIVAWNNCCRFIFRGFWWMESVGMLQFYCSSLLVSCIIDQRRLLFWKRMSSSDNLVLRSLIYFVSSRALAVSSTYGVTTAMSVSVIKDAAWDSFARTIS